MVLTKDVIRKNAGCIFDFPLFLLFIKLTLYLFDP